MISSGDNINPPTLLSKAYHPFLFLRFLGLICIVLFLDKERRLQSWYVLAVNGIFFILTLVNMDHFLFPKIYLVEEFLLTIWSGILVINAYDDINPYWGLNSFWVFSLFELFSYFTIMLLEVFIMFTMIPLICSTLSENQAKPIQVDARGVGNLSLTK
jgi:hypothetical protein